MKKLLAMTLALGLFLGGCGGPTPKEEAKMIYDKYVANTATLSKLALKSSEMLSANAPIEEIEKNNVLLRQEIEKAKSEKVSDKVKAYKNAVIIRGQKAAELIDYSIAIKKAEANNDNSSISKYIEKIEDTIKSANAADFNIDNEKHIIDTGKPLPTMTAGGKEYVCSIASNVLMCVTDYKITTKPVGDGFSTPIAPIGKFVYVTVAVYNDQKDAINVDANNFKIIYNDREYSHNSAAQFTYEIANKRRSSSMLNPGMGIKHTYIFDVPKDFDYTKAKVQARGGFTGDTVLLQIPAREKPAN